MCDRRGLLIEIIEGITLVTRFGFTSRAGHLRRDSLNYRFLARA